jgi:cytochrome P450
MTTDLDRKPLPPGDRYLPVVGETFSFLADSFGFIERRMARHGPVFRTSLLGRTTVVLAGPAVSHVFIDEDLCTRDDAMPDNVRELLGGRNVAVLDGTEHRTRKGHVLSAFLPEALPSYVPVMERLVEAALADWSARGGVRASDELQRLAIAVIAHNLLSLEAG